MTSIINYNNQLIKKYHNNFAYVNEWVANDVLYESDYYDLKIKVIIMIMKMITDNRYNVITTMK